MHGSNLMHGACSLPFSNGASTSFLGGDQSDISVRLAFRPGLERNEQVTEHTRATRRNIRAFPSDYDIIDRRLLLSREHLIGNFFTPTAKQRPTSPGSNCRWPLPYTDRCRTLTFVHAHWGCYCDFEWPSGSGTFAWTWSLTRHDGEELCRFLPISSSRLQGSHSIPIFR